MPQRTTPSWVPIILIRLHIGKRILQEKAPEISWFGSSWKPTPVAVSREIALINMRWQLISSWNESVVARSGYAVCSLEMEFMSANALRLVILRAWFGSWRTRNLATHFIKLPAYHSAI
jgi:hypothetical protein